MPTYPTYKLGQICELLNGYAFKSSNYVPNGLRVIRITNVKKGYVIDEEPQFYPIETQEELKKYILKKDDLLISLTGNVGRVGILEEALLPAALNQRVGCLRVKDSNIVLLQYLYHLLNTNSFEKDCINSSRGIAQKNMSTEWLKEYEIKLPPLPTQHQIVSRIESLFAELDKAVEHLRTARQQLKIYKQAVLNHWLNNEDGKWEKMTAEECVVDENYSLAIGPFGSDLKVEDYTESGVKLVFVRDITSKFEDKKNKFVSEYKADQLKAHNVFKGDLLITKMGDPPGQTGIFPFDRGVITSDVLRMKTNDQILNKYYAMYYILSSEGGKQIKEMTQGVAQKKISLGRFKKFLFPVPSISEQQRIVEEIESRLSQAEAAEARIAEALQKTEALRQSILKKAFSGELVVSTSSTTSKGG